MGAVIERKEEPVLTDELRNLYSASWKTANESFRNLKLDSKQLDEIREPRKLNANLQNGQTKDLDESMKQLSGIFSSRNNLPERASDEKDIAAFFKWINSNLGMKLNMPKNIYPNVWAAHGKMDVLTYQKGADSAESVIYIIHEMDHIKKPFSGLSADEEEITSSRSRTSQEIRRNYKRYSEGSAMFATTGILRSSDDALKAYYSIFLMEQLANPSPQSHSDSSEHKKAHLVRFSEGLRHFIQIDKDMKEKLKVFEQICAENNLLPGINREGKLCVANPSTFSMYEIDLEKLKRGITDIEKLKKEYEPLFSRKLD